MSASIQSLNVEVTSAGFAAIAQAILTNSSVTVASFKIGSDFGFVPVPGETAVHTLVFTQTQSSQMQPSLVNPDTVDFKIIVDSTLGPFTIGNLGLYLDNGTLFAIAVLTEPDYQVPQTVGMVGTSYEYDIVVIVTGLGVVINPTILIDTYAVIPFVATELNLPSPISPPYTVYRVIGQTATNLSTFALQDSVNDIWLGTPFMSDIQSDYFDILDGGCGGDVTPYIPTYRTTWGGYYEFIPDNVEVVDFGSYGGDGTETGNWDYGEY